MLVDYKSGKRRGCNWRPGPVDPDREHIELRYGDASEATYEQWTPAALVGRPIDRVCPVCWVLAAQGLRWSLYWEIFTEVTGELDFYLVRKGERDPWSYARYRHGRSGANMYSRVHWSYFPTGRQGKLGEAILLDQYNPGQKSGWSWRPGPVDPDGEHIELRYGDASKATYEQWTPAALVGRPIDRVFPVRSLLVPPSLKWEVMKAVIWELDFFLVEKGERDPWGYAQYHCNTGANMYSRVHWSYFPSGQQGKRLSSMVVRLSAEEAAQLFPEKERQRNEPEGK